MPDRGRARLTGSVRVRTTAAATAAVAAALAAGGGVAQAVGHGFAVPALGLLLLVVVAGATWVLVGRALQPLETIRAEAAAITRLGVGRRLTEPASGDEVARLAATLNGVLDRLEASHDKQRAFLADASHELRSPLASLRAQLEIGLAGGERTDWASIVPGALAEEARVEALVRDLLLLARLDQQPPDPAAGVDHPLVDLAQTARDDLASRPARDGVALVLDVDGAPTVRMPRDLARRLVGNLVDNAQRHATARVVVTAAVRGGRAAVTVQDDGPGVPPADRERVFERFTRLDPARGGDDDGGAGLGLAIVRDIVARHGGTVGFADCARGARVEVRLPLAGGPHPHPAPPPGPDVVPVAPLTAREAGVPVPG